MTGYDQKGVVGQRLTLQSRNHFVRSLVSAFSFSGVFQFTFCMCHPQMCLLDVLWLRWNPTPGTASQRLLGEALLSSSSAEAYVVFLVTWHESPNHPQMATTYTELGSALRGQTTN